MSTGLKALYGDIEKDPAFTADAATWEAVRASFSARRASLEGATGKEATA